MARLALEYKAAVRARVMPEVEWVREQGIEQLYRAGLIVRGTAGMRITEAGLNHIAAKLGTGSLK